MDHDEDRSLSLGTEMSVSVPPPSPLTGCYLLAVIGEPHTEEHKEIILQRLVKGLQSWDSNEHQVDLEKELMTLTAQAPEGEDARNGERLIQFASENLVTEILIHPQMNTLMQCMRNLLSSFTRHRHLIHAGYTFAGNGSWIVQDGTFSLADFTDAYQENEVQRVIRAYENSISIDIHCSTVGGGEWANLPEMPFVKYCKLRVNPKDILDSGSQAIKDFVGYLNPYIIPASLEQLLVSSDVVGNIRFSHPTLYVFPGGQGDAALFGINGFNMLVDGGFSRKACWWDFARHLDRLDAVMLTRINNCSVAGMAAVLKRKAGANVYPHIGHFFCNLEERRVLTSPDGDKDSDPLLVSLLQEGSDMMADVRHINLKPQHCWRSPDPINLYHKVGHGTLDMYVLNPSKDSKHVRDFLKKWHDSEQKLFKGPSVSGPFNFPIPNIVSICALLVWRPANPDDNVTRIMFPGSTPQHKIFEGLEKLKHLEFLQHPKCTGRQIATTPSPVPIAVHTTVKRSATKPSKDKLSTNEKKDEKTEKEAVVKTGKDRITSEKKNEKIFDSNQTEKFKDETDSNNYIDNKLINELIDGEEKKIESVLREAITSHVETKLDSTSVESITKKQEFKKKDKFITDKKIKRSEKTEDNKDATLKLEAKKSDQENKSKVDIRKKVDAKVTSTITRAKSTQKTSQKMIEKKVISTTNDKKPTMDKSPPSTPKKSTEIKVTKDPTPPAPARLKTKIRKQSPGSTPAKSTKEANNRRVVESKYKQASPKRELTAKSTEKKEIKVKREPISRRPRPLGSPVKTVKLTKSPTKAAKSIRTDPKLKGLQRVNYEDILKDAKKSDEENSKSIDDFKQDIDDKEEQEIVREIEAVFNRDSEADEKVEFVGRSDIEKITCLISDAKTEATADTEFEEEYLIIEKEEIDPYTEESALGYEQREQEDELQKHAKDKKESEKNKDFIELPSQPINPEEVMIVDAKQVESKDHSLSVDEKQDLSSEKKTSDSKNGQAKLKCMLPETQQDEKVSSQITVESGATTTAPTLPDDERITLDDIKEDNQVEEKYVNEETKEIIPPQTLANIPIERKVRDIVKTPDEVADLPLHEEVDYQTYEEKKTPTVENKLLLEDRLVKQSEIKDDDVFKRIPDVGFVHEIKVPKNLPLPGPKESADLQPIEDDVIVSTLQKPSHAEVVTVTPGSAPESPMYPESNEIKDLSVGKPLDTVKEYEGAEYCFGFTEKLRETHITTVESPLKENANIVEEISCLPDKIPSIPEDVEKEMEEAKLLDGEKSPKSPKEVEKIVASVAEVLKSDKPLEELIAVSLVSRSGDEILISGPETIKDVKSEGNDITDSQDAHELSKDSQRNLDVKNISPARSATSDEGSDGTEKTVLSEAKKHSEIIQEINVDEQNFTMLRKDDFNVKLSTTAEDADLLQDQNISVSKLEAEIPKISERKLSITLESAKTLEKLEEKMAELRKKDDEKHDAEPEMLVKCDKTNNLDLIGKEESQILSHKVKSTRVDDTVDTTAFEEFSLVKQTEERTQEVENKVPKPDIEISDKDIVKLPEVETDIENQLPAGQKEELKESEPDAIEDNYSGYQVGDKDVVDHTGIETKSDQLLSERSLTETSEVKVNEDQIQETDISVGRESSQQEFQKAILESHTQESIQESMRTGSPVFNDNDDMTLLKTNLQIGEISLSPLAETLETTSIKIKAAALETAADTSAASGVKSKDASPTNTSTTAIDSHISSDKSTDLSAYQELETASSSTFTTKGDQIAQQKDIEPKVLLTNKHSKEESLKIDMGAMSVNIIESAGTILQDTITKNDKERLQNTSDISDIAQTATLKRKESTIIETNDEKPCKSKDSSRSVSPAKKEKDLAKDLQDKPLSTYESQKTSIAGSPKADMETPSVIENINVDLKEVSAVLIENKELQDSTSSFIKQSDIDEKRDIFKADIQDTEAILVESEVECKSVSLTKESSPIASKEKSMVSTEYHDEIASSDVSLHVGTEVKTTHDSSSKDSSQSSSPAIKGETLEKSPQDNFTSKEQPQKSSKILSPIITESDIRDESKIIIKEESSIAQDGEMQPLSPDSKKSTRQASTLNEDTLTINTVDLTSTIDQNYIAASEKEYLIMDKPARKDSLQVSDGVEATQDSASNDSSFSISPAVKEDDNEKTSQDQISQDFIEKEVIDTNLDRKSSEVEVQNVTPIIEEQKKSASPDKDGLSTLLKAEFPDQAKDYDQISTEGSAISEVSPEKSYDADKEASDDLTEPNKLSQSLSSRERLLVSQTDELGLKSEQLENPVSESAPKSSDSGPYGPAALKESLQVTMVVEVINDIEPKDSSRSVSPASKDESMEKSTQDKPERTDLSLKSVRADSPKTEETKVKDINKTMISKKNSTVDGVAALDGELLITSPDKELILRKDSLQETKDIDTTLAQTSKDSSQTVSPIIIQEILEESHHDKLGTSVQSQKLSEADSPSPKQTIIEEVSELASKTDSLKDDIRDESAKSAFVSEFKELSMTGGLTKESSPITQTLTQNEPSDMITSSENKIETSVRKDSLQIAPNIETTRDDVSKDSSRSASPAVKEEEKYILDKPISKEESQKSSRISSELHSEEIKDTLQNDIQGTLTSDADSKELNKSASLDEKSVSSEKVTESPIKTEVNDKVETTVIPDALNKMSLEIIIARKDSAHVTADIEPSLAQKSQKSSQPVSLTLEKETFLESSQDETKTPEESQISSRAGSPSNLEIVNKEISEITSRIPDSRDLSRTLDLTMAESVAIKEYHDDTSSIKICPEIELSSIKDTLQVAIDVHAIREGESKDSSRSVSPAIAEESQEKSLQDEPASKELSPKASRTCSPATVECIAEKVSDTTVIGEIFRDDITNALPIEADPNKYSKLISPEKDSLSSPKLTEFDEKVSTKESAISEAGAEMKKVKSGSFKVTTDIDTTHAQESKDSSQPDSPAIIYDEIEDYVRDKPETLDQSHILSTAGSPTKETVDQEIDSSTIRKDSFEANTGDILAHLKDNKEPTKSTSPINVSPSSLQNVEYLTIQEQNKETTRSEVSQKIELTAREDSLLSKVKTKRDSESKDSSRSVSPAIKEECIDKSSQELLIDTDQSKKLGIAISPTIEKIDKEFNEVIAREENSNIAEEVISAECSEVTMVEFTIATAIFDNESISEKDRLQTTNDVDTNIAQKTKKSSQEVSSAIIQEILEQPLKDKLETPEQSQKSSKTTSPTTKETEDAEIEEQMLGKVIKGEAGMFSSPAKEESPLETSKLQEDHDKIIKDEANLKIEISAIKTSLQVASDVEVMSDSGSKGSSRSVSPAKGEVIPKKFSLDTQSSSAESPTSALIYEDVSNTSTKKENLLNVIEDTITILNDTKEISKSASPVKEISPSAELKESSIERECHYLVPTDISNAISEGSLDTTEAKKHSLQVNIDIQTNLALDSKDSMLSVSPTIQKEIIDESILVKAASPESRSRTCSPSSNEKHMKKESEITDSLLVASEVGDTRDCDSNDSSWSISPAIVEKTEGKPLQGKPASREQSPRASRTGSPTSKTEIIVIQENLQEDIHEALTTETSSIKAESHIEVPSTNLTISEAGSEIMMKSTDQITDKNLTQQSKDSSQSVSPIIQKEINDESAQDIPATLELKSNRVGSPTTEETVNKEKSEITVRKESLKSDSKDRSDSLITQITETDIVSEKVETVSSPQQESTPEVESLQVIADLKATRDDGSKDISRSVSPAVVKVMIDTSLQDKLTSKKQSSKESISMTEEFISKEDTTVSKDLQDVPIEESDSSVKETILSGKVAESLIKKEFHYEALTDKETFVGKDSSQVATDVDTSCAQESKESSRSASPAIQKEIKEESIHKLNEITAKTESLQPDGYDDTAVMTSAEDSNKIPDGSAISQITETVTIVKHQKETEGSEVCTKMGAKARKDRIQVATDIEATRDGISKDSSQSVSPEVAEESEEILLHDKPLSKKQTPESIKTGFNDNIADDSNITPSPREDDPPISKIPESAITVKHHEETESSEKCTKIESMATQDIIQVATDTEATRNGSSKDSSLSVVVVEESKENILHDKPSSKEQTTESSKTSSPTTHKLFGEKVISLSGTTVISEILQGDIQDTPIIEKNLLGHEINESKVDERSSIKENILNDIKDTQIISTDSEKFSKSTNQQIKLEESIVTTESYEKVATAEPSANKISSDKKTSQHKDSSQDATNVVTTYIQDSKDSSSSVSPTLQNETEDTSFRDAVSRSEKSQRSSRPGSPVSTETIFVEDIEMAGKRKSLEPDLNVAVVAASKDSSQSSGPRKEGLTIFETVTSVTLEKHQDDTTTSNQSLEMGSIATSDSIADMYDDSSKATSDSSSSAILKEGNEKLALTVETSPIETAELAMPKAGLEITKTTKDSFQVITEIDQSHVQDFIGSSSPTIQKETIEKSLDANTATSKQSQKSSETDSSTKESCIKEVSEITSEQEIVKADLKDESDNAIEKKDSSKPSSPIKVDSSILDITESSTIEKHLDDTASSEVNLKIETAARKGSLQVTSDVEISRDSGSKHSSRSVSPDTKEDFKEKDKSASQEQSPKSSRTCSPSMKEAIVEELGDTSVINKIEEVDNDVTTARRDSLQVTSDVDASRDVGSKDLSRSASPAIKKDNKDKACHEQFSETSKINSPTTRTISIEEIGQVPASKDSCEVDKKDKSSGPSIPTGLESSIPEIATLSTTKDTASSKADLNIETSSRKHSLQATSDVEAIHDDGSKVSRSISPAFEEKIKEKYFLEQPTSQEQSPTASKDTDSPITKEDDSEATAAEGKCMAGLKDESAIAPVTKESSKPSSPLKVDLPNLDFTKEFFDDTANSEAGLKIQITARKDTLQANSDVETSHDGESKVSSGVVSPAIKDESKENSFQDKLATNELSPKASGIGSTTTKEISEVTAEKESCDAELKVESSLKEVEEKKIKDLDDKSSSEVDLIMEISARKDSLKTTSNVEASRDSGLIDSSQSVSPDIKQEKSLQDKSASQEQSPKSSRTFTSTMKETFVEELRDSSVINEITKVDIKVTTARKDSSPVYSDVEAGGDGVSKDSSRAVSPTNKEESEEKSIQGKPVSQEQSPKSSRTGSPTMKQIEGVSELTAEKDRFKADLKDESSDLTILTELDSSIPEIATSSTIKEHYDDIDSSELGINIAITVRKDSLQVTSDVEASRDGHSSLSLSPAFKEDNKEKSFQGELSSQEQSPKSDRTGSSKIKGLISEEVLDTSVPKEISEVEIQDAAIETGPEVSIKSACDIQESSLSVKLTDLSIKTECDDEVLTLKSLKKKEDKEILMQKEILCVDTDINTTQESNDLSRSRSPTIKKETEETSLHDTEQPIESSKSPSLAEDVSEKLPCPISKDTMNTSFDQGQASPPLADDNHFMDSKIDSSTLSAIIGGKPAVLNDRKELSQINDGGKTEEISTSQNVIVNNEIERISNSSLISKGNEQIFKENGSINGKEVSNLERVTKDEIDASNEASINQNHPVEKYDETAKIKDPPPDYKTIEFAQVSSEDSSSGKTIQMSQKDKEKFDLVSQSIDTVDHCLIPGNVGEELLVADDKYDIDDKNDISKQTLTIKESAALEESPDKLAQSKDFVSSDDGSIISEVKPSNGHVPVEPIKLDTKHVCKGDMKDGFLPEKEIVIHEKTTEEKTCESSSLSIKVSNTTKESHQQISESLTDNTHLTSSAFENKECGQIEQTKIQISNQSIDKSLKLTENKTANGHVQQEESGEQEESISYASMKSDLDSYDSLGLQDQDLTRSLKDEQCDTLEHDSDHSHKIYSEETDLMQKSLISIFESTLKEDSESIHTLASSSEDISKEISCEEKHSFECLEKESKKYRHHHDVFTSSTIKTEIDSSHRETISTKTAHVESGSPKDISLSMTTDSGIMSLQVDNKLGPFEGADYTQTLKDNAMNLMESVSKAFSEDSVQQGIKTESVDSLVVRSEFERVSTPPTVPVSPLPKTPSSTQDLKVADGIQSELTYDKSKGAEETITKVVHVGDDILTQKISTSTEKAAKPAKVTVENDDSDLSSLMHSMGKIQTETDTVTKVIKEGVNVVTQTITTVTTKEIISREDGTPQNVKTTIETTTLSKGSDGSTTTTKDTQTLLSECSSSLKSTSQMDLYAKDVKLDKEYIDTSEEKSESLSSQISDKDSPQKSDSSSTRMKNEQAIPLRSEFITTVDDDSDDNIEDTVIDTDVSKKIIKEGGLDIVETAITTTKKEVLKLDDTKKIIRTTTETNTTKERPDGSKDTQKNVDVKTEEINYDSKLPKEEIDQSISLDEKFVQPIKIEVDRKATLSSVGDTVDEIGDNSVANDIPVEQVLEGFTKVEDQTVNVDTQEKTVTRDGVLIKQRITITTTKEILVSEDGSKKKLKTTIETVTESKLPNGTTEVVKDVKISISDYGMEIIGENLEGYDCVGEPEEQTASHTEELIENNVKITRKTTITTIRQEFENTKNKIRKIKTIVRTVIEDEHPNGTVFTKKSEKTSIADVFLKTPQSECDELEIPDAYTDLSEVVEKVSEDTDVKSETIQKENQTIIRTVTTKTKRETLKTSDATVKRIRTTIETITVDEYPNGATETTKDVKVTVSETQTSSDSKLQSALAGLESTGKIKTSVDKKNNIVVLDGEEVTQTITTKITKEEFNCNDTDEVAIVTVTETITETANKDGSIEIAKDLQTQITYLPHGTKLDDLTEEHLEVIETSPVSDHISLELPLQQKVTIPISKQKSPIIGEPKSDTEVYTKHINENGVDIEQTITVVTTKELISPDKVKTTVETTTVNKGSDGVTKTLKATKTTFSDLEEKYGTGESEKSLSKTDDLRSSSAASDDLAHGLGSPPSDLSSRESKATHAWGTESSGIYYSDEDGPGSPSSTKSQIAHSPRSNLSFELEPSKTLGMETSFYRDPMSSSVYAQLPEELHHEVKTEKTITKLTHEFLTHEKLRAAENIQDMNVSDASFLTEADEHFNKAIEEHKKVSGSEVISNITAKYDLDIVQSISHQESKSEESQIVLQNIISDAKKVTEVASSSTTTSKEETKTEKSETSSESTTITTSNDPIESWGKPLGLPSPIMPPTQSDGKSTPKKQNPMLNKNKLNQDKIKEARKSSESPSKRKPPAPVYLELTYVPHHGNSYYSAVEFFKRVRARYYVFSGTEPSKEIYNALLDAKKTWEDKDLEVTIIPTYDTDVLGYWVTENEDALEKYKIDLSPSASRCTINLQDHETSCAAYRLEF